MASALHSGDANIVTTCFKSERLGYETEFQRAPFLSGGLGEEKPSGEELEDLKVVRRKRSAKLLRPLV